MPLFDDILDKSLKRTVDPSTEPLTLDEAKLHCSIPSAMTDFDSMFNDWIVSAREMVENDCERALMPQTWELAMEQFPRPTPYYAGNLSPQFYTSRQIQLRRPPVTSIVSFGYYDQTSTWQTMTQGTDYLVNFAEEPALVTPPVSSLLSGSQVAQLSWPVMLPQVRGVVIVFQAGYADAYHVPKMAKQAMRLLIGHWWRTREAAGEKPAKDHDRAYQSLIESLKWRN